MKKKKFCRLLLLVVALGGGLELLGNAVAWILSLTITAPGFSIGEAVSIGIIGGADGPTAIFVTTPTWTGYIIPLLCLVIGLWGYFHLRKCKQK